MIECVPNFSEGEDEELIGQIVSSIKTAKVLDVHSDPDHNRSVVTMVGKPEEVKQAAFDLTERAMQLLDLRDHQGVHPFIGVMDVIPFIPLKGSTMQEAITTSHELGQELWDKLHLPVYFYGQAAKIQERADLPYVRKGGYAALKREINSPHRRPDIGEGLHLTAGAAAVGARNFLIAYNVNLKTNDLTIAQSIAQNIRESHGGLKGVRALGLELISKGITQVSINITDHQETSLRQVFSEIKVWAKEYRVEILHSELVGLLPQDAVFPDMADVLKLKGFSEKKIIENNL
ncbi:MAG: glutamate formimidoyltransferase [Candidatus Margulisiibacteriota bacterium]